MNILDFVIIFIVYSIIGFLVEVVYSFILQREIINRGFFIGPYCPIYGTSVSVISFLLQKYINDIFILFVMSIVLCSILEYSTSYLLEKLFRARWWDYSNRKFNINGRICLETMIPFGLFLVLILHYSNPFILKLIHHISNKFLYFFIIIYFSLFLIDAIITFNVVNNFKKTSLDVKRDCTKEINKIVKELFSKKGYFKKRLVKAFPKLDVMTKEE